MNDTRSVKKVLKMCIIEQLMSVIETPSVMINRGSIRDNK